MPRAAKSELLRLRAPLGRLRWRARWQNAAKSAAFWAPLPLLSCLVLLLSHRFLAEANAFTLPFRLILGLLFLGLALFKVVTAAFARTNDRELSLRLDRTLGKTDLITNAIYCAEQAESTRSPLQQAVVEQGLAALERVELGRVAPFRRPTLWPVITLTLAILAVSMLPAGSPRKRPLTQLLVPRTTVDWSVPPDELTELQQSLDRVKTRISNQDLLSTTGALEALLRELGQRRISQTEAFERLANLSEGLTRLPQADNALTQAAFQSTGRALRELSPTAALFQALAEGRGKDALQAVAALKARFSEPRRAPSQADLDHLRRAIEREKQALAKRREQSAAEANTLTDERKRLRAKQPGTQISASESVRHQEVERRLQTLDRMKRATERADKVLSALDRALSEAAEALNRKFTGGQPAFSELSQAVEEPIAAELTEAQKRRLLEELRAIEETLSKYGKGQEPKRAELQRYGERAQGRSEGQVTPNPSGSTIIVGLGRSEAPGAAGAAEEVPTAGTAQGRSLGLVHDEQVRGPTETQRLPPETDTTAVTTDATDATVSAEVVARAAERGFSAANYAQVYRAYEPVRESLLERPLVPQAKRGQVRRYFQLIRPRDIPP